MRGRAQDLEPVDPEMAAQPIIARHFFGVEPFRPIGEAAAGVVVNLKRAGDPTPCLRRVPDAPA